MKVRARLRVRGRVQGVSYRWSAVDAALDLGLVGWVRNADDGSVELEAEGDKPRVESLIAWCRKGPPSARVAGVDVEWGAAREDETGFKIVG